MGDRKSKLVIIRVHAQNRSRFTRFWIIANALGIQTDIIFDDLDSAKDYAERSYDNLPAGSTTTGTIPRLFKWGNEKLKVVIPDSRYDKSG